jgi:hypothetical protein
MKKERWIKYASANTHGIYCGKTLAISWKKREKGPITLTKDFLGTKICQILKNKIKVYKFLP